MRKFLAILCFSLFAHTAAAADLVAQTGLRALKVPLEALVSEAAKGNAADLAVIA